MGNDRFAPEGAVRSAAILIHCSLLSTIEVPAHLRSPAEILVLPVSSGFAGAGLILVGAARVGTPFAEVTGVHTAFMDGLGLGVLAVYSIAACYIPAGSSSYPSARSSPLPAPLRRCCCVSCPTWA